MKHAFAVLHTTLLLVLFSCSVFAQTANKDSAITVIRQNASPMVFHKTDMADFRRVTVQLKDRDGKEHDYTGVAISDILQKAGVGMGKLLKGENMAQYMLAKAGDGYEVSYSLAELDSSFTDKTIILADQLDGGPLPTGKGPFRIIVPGEKKPARSMYEIRELIIRFGKDEN
jgi:hypothetical protein